MILLDTTVLVYAKGLDHPLREPCRALIEAVAARRIEATSTVEVIQEFVHVRARRRDRSDAASLGSDYAELLSPLLRPTIEDLDAGLALFERTQTLGAFDAVLAACAARAGVSAIVSADLGFADAPEIAHVVPDRTGVSALLDD
ncbi:MAG TPA: type II toxin-antitoxin system VapC family toxin [Solirubrobacteraceae bacterium]|nr:type II toxin-antitoxin system VapC family toxin [Solirubrobacteraceae bacterium]